MRDQLGLVSAETGSLFNLKTAVDSQRGWQVIDILRFSTAAHFTKWVTTAVASNTSG
jgi:hypothetical protein